MSMKSPEVGDVIRLFPGSREFKVLTSIKDSSGKLNYVLEGVSLMHGLYILSEKLLRYYEVSRDE